MSYSNVSFLKSLCTYEMDDCENKWDKVFKNGPSKVCGRQPLKDLKWYGLL